MRERYDVPAEVLNSDFWIVTAHENQSLGGQAFGGDWQITGFVLCAPL